MNEPDGRFDPSAGAGTPDRPRERLDRVVLADVALADLFSILSSREDSSSVSLNTECRWQS
ncbi:MAG: hypothetical protein R2742_06330 [Micropruina glycogenica]